MKRNVGVFVIVFSVVLNMFLIAGYAPVLLNREHDNSEHSAKKHQFIYTALKLSTKQIERIKPIRDRFYDKLDHLSEKIREKRLQFIDLLAAEQPDFDAIQAKRREINVLQGALQEVTTEHLLEMRSIFTPEQRRKFFSLLKSRLENEIWPAHRAVPARGDAPNAA